MMILELALMGAVTVSFIIFTSMRVLIGDTMTYPRVYASNNKGTDFLLMNLGELEMICSIFSPAAAGFLLYAFWIDVGYPFSEGVDSTLSMIHAISVFVTLQALLPFA